MRNQNRHRQTVKISLRIAAVALFAALLAACSGSGAGGGSSSGTGTCTATGDYTVEWRFSGSYSDSVSVATTWVKPSGEFSDPSDTKYASINPSTGTLLTETLPACSGASINVVMLDGAGDTDFVTLSNFTLSIEVEGTEVDSVTYTGSYPVDSPSGTPTVLPPSGALTVVVGQ